MTIPFARKKGRPVLSRYDAPRVLRIVLPSGDAQTAVDFFGPVRVFFAEAQQRDGWLHFFLQA